MKRTTPVGHIQRGHVIRLDPTVEQRNALSRASGVARFTFNWALQQWGEQYKAGLKPSANKLKNYSIPLSASSFPGY